MQSGRRDADPMTAGSQISQPSFRLIVRLFAGAGGGAAADQPFKAGSKKSKDALHMASETERVEILRPIRPLYFYVDRADAHPRRLRRRCHASSLRKPSCEIQNSMRRGRASPWKAPVRSPHRW